LEKQNRPGKIPGFNLTRQASLLGQELEDCIKATVDKGVFILGENVIAIEKTLSRYCQASYGVGVASGSDALFLSLLACQVGEGDEVITSPFTFFATAGAISRTGAKPVFVDIDPDTWNIDPKKIESKISSRTKAIVPVHLYGCPADMGTICQIARNNRLKIIEDAAQALGAEYHLQRVGSFGEAGCFSFFPTKNLGALGDGGMVVTRDVNIADRVRTLRAHGARIKYYHEETGCNSRLDEIQAAILNLKYRYLDRWTKRRREIARQYTDLFTQAFGEKGLPFRLPQEPTDTYHVFHQYTIQTPHRNELMSYLNKWRIDSTVYYPLPLHLQKAYSFLGYRAGDLPFAEAASAEVLSLPMFPELTDEEVQIVVDRIVRFSQRKGWKLEKRVGKID